MTVMHRAVGPLRILLVLLFCYVLFAQLFMVPGELSHLAEEETALAPLRWSLLAFSVLELACVQVVIVSTWKLLGMVQHDRIFSEEAFLWVDTIIGAIAAAWLLLLAASLVLGLRAQDPAPVMILALMLIVGAVLGLLMVVMRVLLRQATTLRSDMEAVI